MSSPAIPFQRGAVAPLDAVSEGLNRVRDQYLLFVGIAALGTIIASAAPFGLLMGPMMCGIYLAYRKKWLGQRVRFETLFEGFGAPLFVQSLLAALIMFAVALVAVIPLVLMIFGGAMLTAILASREGGEAAPLIVAPLILLAVLVGLALALLLGALFTFTFPLIVDRGLSGVDAVKLSARAALANIWGVVGLMLVVFGLTLVGALFCYVGAFFVMPITYGAQMAAYVQVFGLAGPAPLEELV